MEFINVKLSDIGEVVGGATPSTKNPDNYDGNIAWITPKDLAGYNKVYISKGERNITEMGFKSCSTKILPKNSVLFSSRAPIGYVAISENDLCTNQGFKSIIPNNKIDYKFLYYLLKHNKNYIASKGSGSTFKEVSGSVMKGIELSIPKNIHDQKKISKILFDIDKKIELNNEINNNLFELMKKMYVEWFKHFNIPNTSFEFKDSELGQIPIDWNIKHLKDVFFFQEGPGIRNWQYVDEDGTKFINIRCIKDRDLELDTANMISNEEAQGKYKHFMLNEWDVVVSTSGTLGRSQIIRKEHLPLCLNTSVIRFKPINGFDEYAFMYNYLISDEFLNLLDVMATGSAQRNFGPMHLKKIDLVYPSKDIINKFNNLIFPIIENIQNNKAENMKLSQLRDTLLPKLMNGEIDLDNIKI